MFLLVNRFGLSILNTYSRHSIGVMFDVEVDDRVRFGARVRFGIRFGVTLRFGGSRFTFGVEFGTLVVWCWGLFDVRGLCG